MKNTPTPTPTPTPGDEKLSASFNLRDFIYSNTAIARGVDNTPTPQHLKHLKRLAGVLEKIHQALGPVKIISAYRSAALCSELNFDPHSTYAKGCGVLFTCPGSKGERIYLEIEP